MLSGAIVDLDGTVYRGDELVPGARAGVDALREAGLSLVFFSNNPTRDGAAYVDHLREMGLDVREGEACSAGVTTTEYLRTNHGDDEVLLVGAPGLAAQLRAADLSLTEDPAAADVLVGSWDPAFDYDDMTSALRAVDGDTAFVGTDPDRTFIREEGHLVPGSGAVVGALARTVGREPDEILGKPGDAALDSALDRLDTAAEDCLIVGDRLDTDILMGERAGMTTVLVLSGVTDRDDLAASDVDPDYVVDSLGDVPSRLGL